MILPFEVANDLIQDGLEKDRRTALKSFGIVLGSICDICIHRPECTVKCPGVADCRYFSRGA